MEPLERALPAEWKRVVRDQPFLSLCGALAAGVYLGRRHSRELLSALVSVGLATAVGGVRRRFGFPEDPGAR
ncbi:MAG: hypothetical protein ABI592_07895 [Acidobacteriota bacterium]